MQYFDNLVEQETVVDEKKLLNEIRDGIGESFRSIKYSLESMRDMIQKNLIYFTEEKSLDQCCHINSSTYSPRHKGNVDFNQTCIAFPYGLTGGKFYPPQDVSEKMNDVYNKFPQIYRVYFGMEDGSSAMYPAQPNKCHLADLRHRPWYIEAVSPVPKDLVILMDISNSMNILTDGDLTLAQIAQEATNSFLKTLSANDRIGIVKFASHVLKPLKCAKVHKCFTKRLAVKTEFNFRCLSEFINEGHYQVLQRETNLTLAINQAFQYFHEESKSSLDHRNQVILLVTDGQISKAQSNKEILEVIASNNHPLENRVAILTFGIGNSIDSTTSRLLKDIAEQPSTNSIHGTVRKGKFFQIKDAKQLRTTLSRYYDLFTMPIKSTTSVISTPYFDLLTSDVIITASAPFFNSQMQVAGVVGIDIALTEMLVNITNLLDSKASYAFLIDNKGRAIAHPLLPTMSAINGSLILINIRSLERSPDAEEIIKSMLSQSTDHKNTVTDVSLAAGDVFKTGVDSVRFRANYYWGPVLYSDMFLCIVIAEENKIAEKLRDFPASPFVYSDFDLLPAPSPLCMYGNKIATKNQSALKFSSNAFKNQASFLYENLTTDVLKTWKKYFEGEENTIGSQIFQPGIRAMVSALKIVDNIWLAHNYKQLDRIKWRYISSMNGVMRIYPAISVKKEFNHNTRPWFIQAINNPGKIVVMAPFIDLWSGTKVIAMSQGIYQKRSHSWKVRRRESPVIAVLTADIPVNYFHELVLNSFKDCKSGRKRCILIDNSGFVLSSPTVIKNLKCGKPHNTIDVHLIKTEPEVAQVLINKNILQNQQCVNVNDLRTQRFWRVRFSGAAMAFEHFDFFEISGTNLFVIIKSKDMPTLNSCSCKANDGFSHCTNINLNSCECPCYENINFNNIPSKNHGLSYDYCSNKFQSHSDILPICTPRPVDYSPLEDSSHSTLRPSCFNNKCQIYATQKTCFASVSFCNWCSGETPNAPSFCSEYQCKQLNCSATRLVNIHEMSKSSSSQMIAIYVTITFFILLAILLLVFVRYTYLYWCCKCLESTGDQEDHSHINGAFRKNGPNSNIQSRPVPSPPSDHNYEVIDANGCSISNYSHPEYLKVIPEPPREVPAIPWDIVSQMSSHNKEDSGSNSGYLRPLSQPKLSENRKSYDNSSYLNHNYKNIPFKNPVDCGKKNPASLYKDPGDNQVIYDYNGIYFSGPEYNEAYV